MCREALDGSSEERSIITEITSAILSDIVGASPNQQLVEINVNSDIDCFEISRACIDIVKWCVPLVNETVYKHDGSSLCPTIAMPTDITCCGKNIKIFDQHATLSLYEIDTVKELLSYHGNCVNCKKMLLPCLLCG